MNRTRTRIMILACTLTLFAMTSLFAGTGGIRKSPDGIPGEYIVVLRKDIPKGEVRGLARALAESHGAVPEKVWNHALNGFFVRMNEKKAEALSHNPSVEYVEENAPWYLSATQATNINPATCDPTAGTCPTVDDNRLWHLDRSDQNYADPTNTFSYCTDGTGKTVYVVDSGVNKFHNEFGPTGSRVKTGYNASGDRMPADDPCMGFALLPIEPYDYLEERLYPSEVLGSGHGTAVASALGGRRVGVAKNVDIVPVKVIRCDRFSARARISNHSYQQNETMFRSPNGASIGALYRAQNTGSTGLTDPGNWPTASGATKLDGGITWEVVNSQEWDPDRATTTPVLVEGLDWILRSEDPANPEIPWNPGPKSHAVVTLSVYRRSTFPGVAGGSGTVEGVIRNLLAANLTVVASANNQNGNACHTSPGRLSINNPDASLANDVITAGGSMIVNRPWAVDISDVLDGVEANPPIAGTSNPVQYYGLEPSYQPALAVRDARWICGPGDSSLSCSNATPIATANPSLMDAYHSFQGGSNAGPCVTLFAPAKNVFLATPASASAYRDARLRGGHASGTSWSAPIVAGFAARILQSNPTYTPAQVRAALLANTVASLDQDTLDTYDYDTGLKITNTPNAMLRLGDVNVTTSPASTPASIAGTTALTVTAGGTSTLSYQWYEVNSGSGFDFAEYKNGAHPPESSTLIGGANGSTYQAPASLYTKAYWVRVKNSCGSADSDIAVVVPHPAVPANVTAIASQNMVTITWSAASGAEQYHIERKVPGQPWTLAHIVPAGTLTTFTYLDTPPVTSGMAIYRVRAAAGLQYLPSNNLSMSNASNNDIANLDNDTFENLAVAPAFSTFKAQMLIELRQAVNSLAVAADAVAPYTTLELQLASLQNQTIRADHLTLLMEKINDARNAVGLPDAQWTLTPAPDGFIIHRSYVDDLRNALK